MKKLYIIFLLSVTSMIAQAQVNLDSLWGVWNDISLSDSSRLKAMDKLAKGYTKQPDSALYVRGLQYNREKQNGASHIPVIAMTASLLKTEINLCFEAGMDNYIPKPNQAEELIGRMYEEMNASQVKI